MTHRVPKQVLKAVSELVEKQLGLEFPPERWPDLERALTTAAPELGLEHGERVARWFLGKPRAKTRIELLAAHLTVGETYFYREPKAFEALERVVLPALRAERQLHEKRLRIWSAGCCTGEEAYSLAISVNRLVPELAEWQVTILGTDVNPRFLQKAMRGIYSRWSFRGVPEAIRQAWFRPRPNGRWEVRARLRKLVRFGCLNLVEDASRSSSIDTREMDVIFCRNVLMYFSRSQARIVTAALHRALKPEGWLFVGASEGSSEMFADFAPAKLAGVIAYRKVGSPPAPCPGAAAGDQTMAVQLPRSGETTKRSKRQNMDQQEDEGVLAQRLANAGRLTEALAACDHALRGNKLNPGHHYLRGLILQEQGALEEAATAFRRAIYLQQDLVVAHFALGKVLERQGRNRDAARSFDNARQLLHEHCPEDVLPQSDGMTAGRLLAIMSEAETAPA